MSTTHDDSGMPQQPVTWWQWVLVYPTLIISFLSAVPTWVEAANSHSLHVDFGWSRDAKEQNRLWQANFSCSQKAVFQNQVTKLGFEIGSFVCDSGDVLLRARMPEANEQLRWIAWKQVVPAQGSHISLLRLFPTAHAAEQRFSAATPAQPTTVICQRWDAGRLLQRVQQGQVCYDQWVNTFNGQVSDRRPAPCTPAC